MASTAIPKFSLNDAAKLRLLCLPYAGGGAAAFHRWRAAQPEWLDIVPVTLPGHDGRLREPACTDLHTLAALLADELAAVFDRHYAIFGYSMGAWLAFELTREVRRRGFRLPELLVVAASRGPHVKSPELPLHGLPDDALLFAVENRYGGIPSAVRASRELLQLLLPALRADMQIVETHEHVEEPPLEIPIIALGGTDDSAVSAGELDEWRRHTTGDFSLRLFPGGHFFLFDGKPVSTVQNKVDRLKEIPPALRAILTRLERGMPTGRPTPHTIS